MNSLSRQILSVAHLSPEAARLSRWFDLYVGVIIFLALAGAFHIHVMLTVGDWDFWVDWKDRRFWVTLTPPVLIAFPAAAQNILWTHFRLPFGATLCVLAVLIGEWLSRITAFHLWSYFPYSLVWPATLIAGGIALDAVLLLTRSFLLTAIIGGALFALLFPAVNWPMLAAYHLPVEHTGELVSVADLIGYSYTRTATPEYLRMIERGTLRTFGGQSTVISAFFAAFLCMLVYIWWWYMGKLFATVRYIPNRLKHKMGL